MIAQNREDLSGQQIGNYEIVSHIADHRVSDLFLARDVKLDRLVYLEMLRESSADNPALAESFQQRMETVALIKDESIAVVSEIDITDDGFPYAVMEYFPAITLAEKLDTLRHEDRTLATIQSLELTKQIAQALGVAHAEELIHHDLRPENILLRDDGSPVLADLGVPVIARMDSAGMARTDGEMLDYASPEEVEGKPLTRRSNIYSLGVVLYELLAGHRPRLPNLPYDIFPQANMPKEEPLEEARPGLAGETYRLVRNCLWRQEWSRFETAEEMITAIETAIFAEQELPKAAAWAPRRRNPVLFAIPIAVIALAALAFMFVRGSGGQEPPPDEPAATSVSEGGEVGAVIPTEAGFTPTPEPTETIELPTEAPFDLSISVLAPPANREFLRDDVINFDWFWPTLPEPGQQFTVYLSDGESEFPIGSLTEPNNGAAYRLQVNAGSLPTEADELLWQVRLENLSSGEVFVASDAIPIRILAVATEAAPTETPTLTPAPTETAAATSTATATATVTSTCVVLPPPGWVSYVVRQGDSVAGLAQRSNITVGTLMRVNCLQNDLLSVGQTLWLPGGAVTPTAPPAPPPTATPGQGGGGGGGGGNPTQPPPTSTTAPPTSEPPTNTPQPEPTKTPATPDP